jgi:DNA-binding transcriptional LysR family regulator
MQIKALEVFCDVVLLSSFSRAATENGISQSAVSQLVNQLESRLGVQLLDRSKRPFIVTAEGKIYFDGCRRILKQLRGLDDEVRTRHEEVSGHVHVASIYSVGLSHINGVVQRFLMRHPKANVRVEYQHPEHVYRLVEEDRVDVGLVSYPRESRKVKVTPWRDEPMLIVMAPDHQLASKNQICVADLHEQDVVGFDRNLRIRQEIDRVLSLRDTHVQVVMEFDNIETIKRAVEINAGIGLLPAPTVVREVAAGTLIARPLTDLKLIRPLGLIRPKGAVPGATARRFIQFLSEQNQISFPPGLDLKSPVTSDVSHAAS